MRQVVENSHQRGFSSRFSCAWSVHLLKLGASKACSVPLLRGGLVTHTHTQPISLVAIGLLSSWDSLSKGNGRSNHGTKVDVRGARRCLGGTSEQVGLGVQHSTLATRWSPLRKFCLSRRVTREATTRWLCQLAGLRTNWHCATQNKVCVSPDSLCIR